MSRRQETLNWLARLVTSRRRLVVGVTLLVTLAFASQIPKLRADPAPESLLSSFEGEEYAVIQKRFEEWFGKRRTAVLLLVESDDVLSKESLQDVHDLSLYFAEKPWVDKVASVTTLNIPRRVKAEEGTSEDGLEEVEVDVVEDGDDLDDLDSLDDLDDLDSLDDDAGDEAKLEDKSFNALLDIIESDPERFPGGIAIAGPALANELKTDPIVVDALVSEEEAQELTLAIEGNPLLQGRLIDEDHTLAGVALQLPELGPREMRNAMQELRTDLARDEFAHITVHVGGLPYLRSVIVEKMRADNLRLIPVTVLVCLFLLMLSFRWVPGVLMPLAAVGVTALIVVGGMGLFGEPMNILNNIIVPLLIIIGISDATHLVQRYRDEVVEEQDPIDAGKRTVRAIAVAVLLTSATTAVGLASLVVSKTVMLRHFGLTAGLGVMASYVVIITFVPAVLTWAKPPKAPPPRERNSLYTNVTMNLVSRLLKWRWPILLLTAAFTAGAGYVASQITVDHALLDQFDETDPVYTTTVLIEEKLDGVRPLELVLVSDDDGHFADPKMIQKIQAIRDWAALRPEIIRTLSYGDMLRESYALLADDPSVRSEEFKSPKQVQGLVTMMSQRKPSPLDAWLTEDGEKARVQFKLRDVGAQATMAFLDDLEKEIQQVLSDEKSVDYSFTGEAYTGSRGQAAVVSDLLGSLLVAIVVIFLLLAFFFRSVRLGLLSIPPNLIPLVATMAYMVWREIPLNVSTVIIFSISLGLAVNGTIHVLARFREEMHAGLGREAALIRAARGTGRAIVISCITLMAGFAVLLLSSFVPVRNFGELISVTIGGCLVATLIVLPPLLRVAGGSGPLRESDPGE
ncbi:MAG: efflux RND transporter permease subunit [Myxococcota bacterium]